MIKFSRGLANQSISAPDLAVLTIPDGDWAIGFVLRFDGVVNGDNPQYPLSTGTFGASRSLNFSYFTSGYVTTPAFQSKMVVYADNVTTVDAALVSASSVTAGTHLYVLQRQTGVVTLYRCEVQSTVRSAADVISEGSTTRTNFIKELDGFGLKFGSRLDDTANRKLDQSMGRSFMITGALTVDEIARLASGEEITGLGKSVVYYSRMSSISDVADRGPNAVPFTVNGSPTTSAEPAYPSGTVVPDPQPTDGLTLVPPDSHKMYQRIGGAASVSISGTYTGTAPASFEYRMYAPDGTTARTAWATLNATASGGNWSATQSIPTISKSRIAVRTKSSTGAVLAEVMATTSFGVGGLIAIIGSSSADKLDDSTSGTGFTPAADTSALTGSTPVWSAMGTVGAATLFASRLNSRLSIPIGMLNYGKSSTTLGHWLNQARGEWTDFAAGVAAAGGKLEAVYITVGSNDASFGDITSRAAHLTRMRQLIANIRELTGQPNLPVLWSGSNNRPLLDPIQANRLRMAEADIGDDPNVYHVQTTDFQVSNDNVHLTPAGFTASVERSAFVLGTVLSGGGYKRGPKITSFTYAGDEILATVQHRNGSVLSPTTAATGYAAADDSGVLSYTVSQPAANQHKLKLSRAIVGQPIVTYQAGSAPDVSNAVFDNGATPLPMVVETDLVATEGVMPSDTTAPVLAGAPIVTAITAKTATLTIPAATDNVAVVAYEYSIDNGTTFTDIANGGRVVNLSALTPSTLYRVQGRARDAAGNRSGVIQTTFTTTADQTGGTTPSFTRSASRIVKAKAAPQSVEGGSFWTRGSNNRLEGRIDPNATIDVTFDWTEVLADIQDTIASVQFDLVGLTNKGGFPDGVFATIFVSNATASPSITCRITTASTPPRVEDRTVYFKVEQQ